MSCRKPAVAGQFYPADESECRQEAEQLLSPYRRRTPAASAGTPLAAIVPHAGWICSGSVAAEALCLLLEGNPVDTVVVFGAAHHRLQTTAALDNHDFWETPLGRVRLDGELSEAVAQSCGGIDYEPRAHALEHSIEVQVPFIQRLCPEAMILPIMVMPAPEAASVGQCVARQARQLARRVVFVGSTDLTHYGPRYGFLPHGSGLPGLRWAKEVNDRRIIDLCLAMDADGVVPEAAAHHNACGSGAIAATLAAARATGADRARLCRHTTSAEVLGERYGPISDAVGYAGLIYIRSGQPASAVA